MNSIALLVFDYFVICQRKKEKYVMEKNTAFEIFFFVKSKNVLVYYMQGNNFSSEMNVKKDVFFNNGHCTNPIQFY